MLWNGHLPITPLYDRLVDCFTYRVLGCPNHTPHPFTGLHRIDPPLPRLGIRYLFYFLFAFFMLEIIVIEYNIS